MHKTPVTTYVLLFVNTVIFLALAFQQQSLMMDTNADTLAILHWGSNINPLTLGGQPWRIISSMFLHFGILHLVVNMYALYSMGIMLEPSIGTTRFTMVYFFCGIVAGISSLVFNAYANSAGASGALFGLYGYRLGAELVHSFGNRKQLTTVIINFAVFVVINAFITLQFSVDLWGHLGGCLAGVFLALLQFKLHVLIRNAHLALSFVPLIASVFLLPLDQVRYYRLFQAVIDTERRTNQFYQVKLSDAQLLDSLRLVLNEWDSLHVSFVQLGRVRAELQQDTSTMHSYVKLHHEETKFRIALIEKESYVYVDSIELMNGRFDSLPPFTYNLNYSPRFTDTDDVKEPEPNPKLVPRRIFYDEVWKEMDDPSTASYYRVGHVDSLGKWQGAVRDFYRDGTIQMKGTYKDNLKQGIFLYYTHHNTYSSAGRYENEESIGKWETYHWNGKLKSEVYYNDRTFIRTIYDSLGRAQVVNGNGTVTEWFENGTVAASGKYRDGRKEGDWFGYHEDGSPYFREAYHDNKLIRGVSLDREGKRYVYDELSLYAYPVNGMDGFKKYVARNIRHPTMRQETGTVKILFNVGDSGELWDFVILKGISDLYDQEAIRLVREGPPWRPGLLHGHIKQPSQGYAEIDF